MQGRKKRARVWESQSEQGLLSSIVTESGLDPKLLESEDGVIVRANVSASGQESLIIALSASEFVAQGIGEGSPDLVKD